MRSTFHGLETAKRSLFTQQAALYTTGHNIANANTAGFSRQVVNMTASKSLEPYGMSRSTIPGQLGTGVEFTSITRIREKFLDDQFRNENKSLGNYSIQQDTLEKLEKIISEPSDSGLRTVIADFFNAWSEMSKAPENADGRKIVREQALAMTDAFNHMATQLNDLKGDLTENIEIRIKEVNSRLGSIGQLNNEIVRIEGLGDNANDLRDQRDLLTDELSKMINIKVEELPDGYRIESGGTELLSGFTPTTIVDTAFVNAGFTAGTLNSGEIFGMITSRDKFVQGYLNDLDKLANTVANGDVEVTLPKGSVIPSGTMLGTTLFTGTVADRTLGSDLTVTIKGLNALHQLGYNFSSAPVGLPFFTNTDGTSAVITAASFTLNKEIADNPTKISASMRVIDDGTGTESVVQGNNSLAVLFSQSRDFRFNFGTATDVNLNTVDAYFRSIAGQLGVQSAESIRQQNNSKVLVDQIDGRRQSVSGVSLDEEMSNMIKFQHAYNAAARNMTVIDELLDKVINGMGTGGR
ncbi:flagellar hook-associated protein FlgK [Cohnella silvisoli]|uniref:Flagellar hook-associated protein 1 n=1 Tax=Cohnella silvisoli TaxID=2873699 RepID=A0ABV1KPU1_9BACL|nr:flagellar hook-associated protein FlgK [Cohnella silvisoli]MCD9022304.1 flagellar hook-associated protein FlgK [Cohnella silvisoli]